MYLCKIKKTVVCIICVIEDTAGLFSKITYSDATIMQCSDLSVLMTIRVLMII